MLAWFVALKGTYKSSKSNKIWKKMLPRENISIFVVKTIRISFYILEFPLYLCRHKRSSSYDSVLTLN